MDLGERFVEVGDAQLWTVVEGWGKPVVLCNGGPGCDDYLGPVAECLLGSARVMRWEPRGCGRSTHDGAYALPQTIADLEMIREASEINEWIVAGHSAGADLALAYALEHPSRVRGVISISGTGVQNDRDWKAAYEAGVAAGKAEPPFEVSCNPEVNRMSNDSWRRFIKAPSLLRQLSRFPVPLLCVVGADDIRPSWPVHQLAMLAPRGRFVELAGADHWPWIGAREALARELCDFVERGCA